MHPFKVYNSVVFRIFTELSNHHHYLIAEHFYHLRKKPGSSGFWWHKPPVSLHGPAINFPLFQKKRNLYPLAITLYFPHPQHMATTNLLSVSMDLPIMDVSYKLNHTICVLLFLASFTYHRVLKIHPCCSRY